MTKLSNTKNEMKHQNPQSATSCSGRRAPLAVALALALIHIHNVHFVIASPPYSFYTYFLQAILSLQKSVQLVIWLYNNSTLADLWMT